MTVEKKLLALCWHSSVQRAATTGRNHIKNGVELRSLPRRWSRFVHLMIEVHMATFRKRVQSDGTTVWHVQLRKRGYPSLTETFKRLSDARAWVQEIEKRVSEGRFSRAFESERRTAAEMIDKFLSDELSKRPAPRRDLVSHLAWWKGEIGRFFAEKVNIDIDAPCHALRAKP